MAEMRVRKEIEKGVQMIQYQVITLMTTNGQAPFVTVFMYLNEVPGGQTPDDISLIILEKFLQKKTRKKKKKNLDYAGFP